VSPRRPSALCSLSFYHHGGTESTERNFLFARSASGSESLRLGEEMTIGQKIAALRARSSNRGVLCRGLEIYQRAFAEGGDSFPWPSSPGQGKKSLSSVASVVNCFQRPAQLRLCGSISCLPQSYSTPEDPPPPGQWL
jgi:hypothetical protein